MQLIKQFLLFSKLIPVLFLMPSYVYAQQVPKPAQILPGNISLYPIFHATMVLQWNGKTIYVDPYHGADGFKNMPHADIVLITDIHYDHLDTATLNGLNTSKAIFIVPQAVADKMPAAIKSQVVILQNGEKLEKLGIGIWAVPMYNLPQTPDAMHTKGRGNGYVLQLGKKRLYISGDTEDIVEMRQLKNIDIAFVCMNLPYTMDVDQAASAVLEFKPKLVLPYHYRGKDGFSNVNEFKKLVDAGKQPIKVQLLNWYGDK